MCIEPLFSGKRTANGPHWKQMAVCIAAAILVLASSPELRAEEAPGRQVIHIATPEWEGQTNADGTGLFFDIVKHVFEPENITIDYRFVPWSRAQKLVSSAQADAMLCVWEEHAREEGQLIPEYPMYVEYTATLMPCEAAASFKGIESLNSLRALWLRGYDYHLFSFLKPIRFSLWHEVDTPEEAWPLLDAGRYDVYIDALIDIEHYLEHTPALKNRFCMKLLWGENAYMAFSPTDKSRKLISIYNTRIKELYNSGELKTIYDNWHALFTESAWYQPAFHNDKD